MSSQSFLWINLGLAVSMAALFVLGRSRLRAPARLNLRRGSGARSNRIGKFLSEEAHQHMAPDNEPKIKNLNVLFMHNGHDWDAYQVLGLPAGSRLEAVQAAYNTALHGRQYLAQF
jgi:hypothetical protein